MTDSTETRSSFGVELELLVAVQDGDDTSPRPIPKRFRGHPGRPIMINDKSVEVMTTIGDAFGEVIRAALEGNRGDRVIPPGEEITDPESLHLNGYRGWTVKRDPTVGDENADSDYRWHDVEVTSPALWATEKSFEEVRRIVQAISEHFWAYAPITAGLHVHYGRGSEWIPFDQLRKIGAFLYAADPVLVQMHPGWRRVAPQSRFAPSNYYYSTLSHGAGNRVTSRHLGVENVEAEPAIIDNITEPNEPEDRRTIHREPQFTTIFKRGSLKGYEFSQETFQFTRHPWLGNEVEEDEYLPTSSREHEISGRVGINEILSCPNAETLSELLREAHFGRCAYNFEAYRRNYYGPAWEINGIPDPDDQPKRTIEFRQAAGTIIPDEVVAQCKIAVRLADYASSTPLRDLWKIMLDLNQAKDHPGWYDVFDLFIELNLVDEARVMQRQMARTRGIEILDEIEGIYKIPLARRLRFIKRIRVRTSVFRRMLYCFPFLRPEGQPPPGLDDDEDWDPSDWSSDAAGSSVMSARGTRSNPISISSGSS
ncbi:hypothetical protein M426DRAFT_6985 [Hypoxylon sp. CI-4A]|nr:hypothetical protein M426DRAFT_6985 [Hypoxylon sp. CI-4A]